jgi:hypothetical protein
LGAHSAPFFYCQSATIEEAVEIARRNTLIIGALICRGVIHRARAER